MGLFDNLKRKQTKEHNYENIEQRVKVYELWLNRNYRTYETLDKSGYKTYEFEGKIVGRREFDPFTLSKHKNEVSKPIGDVTSINTSSYIINEKAYKILFPYLSNHCQIFELMNENQLFYVVNVTDLIDCLDYDKSELLYFSSSNRVMEVEKYVFKTEKLKNATIFKLPEFPKSISYVTEKFKKVIEDNNITGFKFKEL